MKQQETHIQNVPKCVHRVHNFRHDIITGYLLLCRIIVFVVSGFLFINAIYNDNSDIFIHNIYILQQTHTQSLPITMPIYTHIYNPFVIVQTSYVNSTTYTATTRTQISSYTFNHSISSHIQHTVGTYRHRTIGKYILHQKTGDIIQSTFAGLCIYQFVKSS